MVDNIHAAHIVNEAARLVKIWSPWWGRYLGSVDFRYGRYPGRRITGLSSMVFIVDNDYVASAGFMDVAITLEFALQQSARNMDGRGSKMINNHPHVDKDLIGLAQALEINSDIEDKFDQLDPVRWDLLISRNIDKEYRDTLDAKTPPSLPEGAWTSSKMDLPPSLRAEKYLELLIEMDNDAESEYLDQKSKEQDDDLHGDDNDTEDDDHPSEEESGKDESENDDLEDHKDTPDDEDQSQEAESDQEESPSDDENTDYSEPSSDGGTQEPSSSPSSTSENQDYTGDDDTDDINEDMIPAPPHPSSESSSGGDNGQGQGEHQEETSDSSTVTTEGSYDQTEGATDSELDDPEDHQDNSTSNHPGDSTTKEGALGPSTSDSEGVTDDNDINTHEGPTEPPGSVLEGSMDPSTSPLEGDLTDIPEIPSDPFSELSDNGGEHESTGNEQSETHPGASGDNDSQGTTGDSTSDSEGITDDNDINPHEGSTDPSTDVLEGSTDTSAVSDQEGNTDGADNIDDSGVSGDASGTPDDSGDVDSDSNSDPHQDRPRPQDKQRFEGIADKARQNADSTGLHQMMVPDKPEEAPEDEDMSGKDQYARENVLKELAEDIQEFGDKMPGGAPSAGDDFVEFSGSKLKKPTSSWKKALPRMLEPIVASAQMSGQSDMSFAKRNPNQQPDMPVMMGFVSYPPEVTILVDSSPSMMMDKGKLLSEFVGVMKGMFMKYAQPLTVAIGDSDVRYAENSMTPYRKIVKEAGKTHMGSSMTFGETIYNIARKGVKFKGRVFPKPDLFIIMTDCAFEWPWKDRSGPPTNCGNIIVISTEPYEKAKHTLPKWVRERKNFIHISN